MPPMIPTDLPYRPRDPKSYRPKIGLIGCGWVTEYHLKAYTHAGYDEWRIPVYETAKVPAGA